MTYLLDVNALLALCYETHVHHQRAEAWLASKKGESGFALATCAITELGFVRVACGPAAHSVDVAVAKATLARLRTNVPVRFLFLSDDLGAEHLPAWVRKSSQTTDGHLTALAGAHGARLLTFDTSIPGAELID
jgi:predicted nucleic acid-binding protein